ncbi:WD40 associated region in TFIID subunit [Gregarina niphandrodes]|uniref:WD40 associated region in TFIID subunit n=1 Tax=Gregarina niphandrodes TaxID=110365 RepID=A0A023B1N2_GRENI|nr:WD40 associated region in TFIID subunit [Gregarina niphandrodes]EZG46957.1 WD40 associated region in TFIID subunit [Gregarina niphandrodes]|eukprot:XP_011132232.1 WD40 associated region in TFIID subunit [Gregarina niphandrodes]
MLAAEVGPDERDGRFVSGRSGNSQAAAGASDVPLNAAPGNMAPGNMAQGNMAQGNMAQGNMAPGNMVPGNMAPGNMAPGGMAGGGGGGGGGPGGGPPGPGGQNLFVSAARRLTARENPLASYSSFCFLYSSFFDWCCSTVPPMSCSLREIAFVVFVELWSRLLPVDQKKSESFLRKFADPHFIAHHSEISEMRRIKSLVNVRDTSFVSRILRGEKFNLHVDLLTRKLLTTRLTLENDTVILDILQKRIQFETPSEKGSVSADSTLAVIASQTFRSPVSRDVGGAIVTPSLALLSGLPPPDLGSENLDASFRPFAPEPASSVLPAQLASLYRTPYATRLNSPGEELPALDWRIDQEAKRRYTNFLRRADVGKDLLPSVLNFRIKRQRVRGLFSKSLPSRDPALEPDQGQVHSAVVNPVGTGQVCVCDNTCLWVFDAAESQWAHAAELYAEAVVTPWARGFVEHARGKEDDVLDELVILNRTQEINYTHNTAGEAKQPHVGVRCLTGHASTPISFKFAPPFLTGGSMSLGLSGGYDEKLILWDIKTAQKLHTYRCGSAVNAVDVDPYGYLFASAHQDRAACLWSMDRTNPLRVLPRHYSAVEAVAFHPNSILLATGSADESRLRIWDPRVPDIVGAITGISQPRLISFAPNGRLICVGGYSSTLHVWDLVAAKLFAVLDISPANAPNVNASSNVNTSSNGQPFPVAVSFSNNSQLVATCCNRGVVRLWDPASETRGLAPPDDLPMTEVTSSATHTQRSNLLQEINLGPGKKAIGAQFTETNVLIVPSVA